MTVLLTDNLPLLAGAPNGIKKLRELILELAVRGKLVPQDPSDEPASELLKRIAEEKARLLAEGKIKQQKPLSERDSENPAFELPAGWAWARLADVVNVLNGRAYKKEELLDAGTPVLRVGNLFTSNHWYYSTLTLEEDKYCNPGDLLFAWSASFGPFIWHGERSIYHYHIWKLDFYAKGQLSKHYLYNYLLEQTQEIKAAGHGVSMVHMTKEKMEKLVVPVPPLPEQHRIVAKVDELMALCDRLEAQQADAESAHAQLVQALLDSLTQAGDAADFAANWQRLAEHFHTLFTTEPSIDALKQTLLQLAVMGKLVPQDPSDEPASELLNRITEEKTRLVAEGKLKKQKPLAEVTDAELPFQVPQNWAWSRIGELALNTEYGLSEKTFDLQDGVPVLKMGDIQSGQVLLGGQMKVSRATEGLPELYLEPEDLLYNRTNSAELVGKTGLFLGSSGEFTFASYLIRIRCLKSLFSPTYLNISMNTPAFRETQINPHLKQQCGQANVNGTIMKNMLVSVPPIAEQHRIVTKVDQLMSLCDQLKTRLTKARQLNEQLARTLVERTLADDGQQAPVTTVPKTARTLLAAEITHQLHGQRTFGQRKLQKVIYLAEHAARLAVVKGNYLRDAAGPHDRQLMNQVESELCNLQWYECIDRETFGHAYRPLSQAGQHRQAYDSAWSTAERATIERVIDLMRDWDTDRCEMTVTLYAAWNDFILEGRPVIDEAIVDEVMHSWNDAKLRFGKDEWLAVLAEMKKHELLIPTGFGQRTTGGMLTLPGVE